MAIDYDQMPPADRKRLRRALEGSEAAFQARVLELARDCGWLRHAERPAVGRSGRWSTPIQGDAGFPDLVLAKGGRVLFWELKMKRGKLPLAQDVWQLELVKVRLHSERAVEYQVLLPADWGYIEKTLKEA